MKYKRVLLKLSGESLAGGNRYGIESQKLEQYAFEIQSAHKLGAQVAVVLGGGNIFRGFHGNSSQIDRVQGDYMGMLATVINSLGLKAVLQNIGIRAVVLGGIAIDPLCEKMCRESAINYLEKGYVVLICGGTGNPFFTTDSAAALRAAEINAEIILKGTRVDGIYTDDPEKNPTAAKLTTISFDEAYKKGLKIMDLTAFTLCRENNLPLIVFDINTPGNLQQIIMGESIGTLVTV